MSVLMSLRKPFKRGEKWYYELDRKRLSLKTTDKATAMRLFNEIRRQYLAGKIARIGGESSLPLGAFTDEVLEWAAQTQEYETFKVWRNALKKLVAVAGRNCRLDAVGLRHWDQLRARAADSGAKASSVNAYRTGLRGAFSKAVEWGYLKASPFAAVKALRVEKRPPAYVEPGEVGKLLASIQDVEVRQVVAALIYSGRRQGELLALQWADIEESGYTATLFKTKRRKRFPVHPMFRAVLDAIPREGERVFPRWGRVSALSTAIKKALTAAGYGHLRPHDLRHTFASLLVITGVELKVVQELLGHTDIRSTQIYAHLSEDAIEAGLKRLAGVPADFLRTVRR